MSSEPGDGELVAMTLRDRNCYGLIVGRYEAPLVRYVKRLLGTHGGAVDDVLQEAFIKAYVNLRAYDQTRPFAPWIYRIAHNEAFNYLRRRRVEPQMIDGEDGLFLLERLGGGSEPSAVIAAEGAEKRLAAGLRELGDRYRDVLVLRFLEERSYSDISDILELPPGTVATLIRRGLKRLKAKLESTDHSAEHWMT